MMGNNTKTMTWDRRQGAEDGMEEWMTQMGG